MSADQIRIELARILATFPPFSRSELRIGEHNGDVKKLQIVQVDNNDCDGTVGELTHLLLTNEELKRYSDLFQDPESKNSYSSQLNFVKQHIVSWYLNIPPRQDKKAVVMKFLPTKKPVVPEEPKVEEAPIPKTPVLEVETVQEKVEEETEPSIEGNNPEVKKPGRKKKDV